MAENSELGMYLRSLETKVYFCQYMWMDIKMAGKKQIMAPMWKKLMKNVDIGEPTSFLDHVYWRCTQRECKPNDAIIEQYTKMFESRISAGATQKPLAQIVTYPSIWKDMLKNALSDVVNWQTRKWSNCT